MIKKKLIFKLRTLESFIVCSPHWQTCQFQVSLPRFWAFYPHTRSSSPELMLCHNSGVSGIPSKPSSPISDLIKPVLVLWGSGCQNYRRQTARPKNWDNKRPMATKKSITFFTIRAYRLYPKPFKWNWLAVTTTILYRTILAFRKLANWLSKSTTGQPFAIMLRPMWKAVTFT